VPVKLPLLPPVDVVVVSHDHYDHLDYPTIRELAKIDVPFVTSLGVGAHLEARGVRPARINGGGQSICRSLGSRPPRRLS
jgi:L-ascorbate metabolism protein UlaG (beta-lactamase superfamily)